MSTLLDDELLYRDGTPKSDFAGEVHSVLQGLPAPEEMTVVISMFQDIRASWLTADGVWVQASFTEGLTGSRRYILGFANERRARVIATCNTLNDLGMLLAALAPTFTQGAAE